MLRSRGGVWIGKAARCAEDFERLTRRFATDFRIHHDPTRQRLGDRNRTQSVTGGQGEVALHAERSYMPFRPDLLFLFCFRAASAGGATTVCDGAELFQDLPAETQRHLTAMRSVFRLTLEPPCWREQWNVSTIVDASLTLERLLDRSGERPYTSYRFEDERLLIEYQAPGAHEAWVSGRKAHASYLLQVRDAGSLELADGGRLDPGTLEEIRRAAAMRTRDVLLEAGDVLILDNTRMMHGRRAFADSSRMVMSRIGDVRPDLRLERHP